MDELAGVPARPRVVACAGVDGEMCVDMAVRSLEWDMSIDISVDVSKHVLNQII